MDVALRAIDKGCTEPTAELRKYPRQRQKQNASEGTLFDPSVFS
jgi:hypothetical protein